MQSIARYFAPAHLAFVLIFLIGALSLSATTLILVDDRSYEQTIAAAKALATEGSWAKARDAYTEALPLAPDADARRWCELWLEDATWRSEEKPGWQALLTWTKQHHEVYNRLLQPYADGRSRDDFWREAIESRADLKSKTNDFSDHWTDRLEIADYLASQPPSTDTANTYVSYIRSLSDRVSLGQSYGLDANRLLAHMENGARVGVSREDRAWCLLSIAKRLSRAGNLTLQERDERWQHALTEARGTRWESLARLEELNWRIRRMGGEKLPPHTPKDVPAALAELADLRNELKNAAQFGWQAVTKLIVEQEKFLHEPQLQLHAPSQLRSGAPLALSYGTNNIESLHAMLEQRSLQGALLEVIDTKLPSPDDEITVREWDIPLPDSRPDAWNSQVIEVSPKLAPGLYKLRLEGRHGSNTLSTSTEILVTDYTGVSFSTERGESQAFIQDAITGAVVPEAKVEGWIGADDLPLQALSTRTDTEGKFTVPALAPHPADDSRDETIAALVNGQPVGFERQVNEPFHPQFRLILDAIFDRPLYRPGETVHWKLIARERRDGRFAAPSDTAGLMLFAELKGDVLLDAVPIKFNVFGTAHGKFVLPANAKPGEANFVVGTTKDNEVVRVGGIEDAFRVDNFVPNAVEAKVELASGPDSLRAGRDLVFHVNATYLSGGPVVGAKVECALSSDLTYGVNRSTLNEKFKAWAEALGDKPMFGATDARGHAEFRLRITDDLPEFSWLNLSAKVLPEGTAEAKAEATWGLSIPGVFLDAQTWREPRLGSPGADLAFDGRIVDGTNSPAQLQGEARLVELRWTEAWLDPQGNVVTGPELSRMPPEEKSPGAGSESAWRKLHAEYAVTDIASQSVSTDAFGRLCTHFKVPRAGIFQIRIYREGTLISAGDRPLRTGPTVFAADMNTTTLALAPDEGFVIGPPSARPGEKCEVLVVLPQGVKTGWLNICGESSVTTHRIASENRVTLLPLAALPPLFGYGGLELYWDNSNRNQRMPVRARITSQDERLALTVALQPHETDTRPGAGTTMAIRVSDSTGHPIKTELGFTSYDEAVAKLLGKLGQMKPAEFLEDGRVIGVKKEPINAPSDYDEPSPHRDPRILPIPTSVDDSSYGAGDSLAFKLLTDVDSEDETVIALSPFEVSSSEDIGYFASDTLAGNRVRTELRDRASSITVVSKEFLKDVGATSQDEMLLYESSTEVGGVKGNFAGLKEKPITIRRHFSSTAFWAPAIVTDEKGEATVSFKYPDNLTQWRLEAYAVGADGNSFGRAATFTRTSLPFQARLQLPRFLVAGDTAEPSALLLNRTDADFSASAELKLDGAVVATDPAQLAQKGIAIPKQGEAHTAWNVKAQAAGTAEFTLTGRAGAEGDAMMLPLPVLEDGIQQLTAASGRLTPDTKRLDLKLELPKPLDPQRTHVTVQLTPSHAAVVLDALPYLVDYPYGCVEQTMSRFLPAVIAQKTLADLGLNAAAIEQRILIGESPADAKRRTGTAGLAKIDDVVQKSLGRLIEAQSRDGGFGWWPGATSTNLWMTAYVAWGLGIAKSAGVTVPADLESNTWRALTQALSDEASVTDEHAWALASLANAKLDDENSTKIATASFDRVYAARERLSATGRACLAQASVKFGSVEQRAILLRNLENGAERVRADNLGDTVHWGKTSNYWNAMDGAVETTSLTLLALLELDPKHPLIEPAMNWLVLNRRSAHWQSTRDSAFAVLALTRYIAQRHELGGDLEVEAFAQGKSIGRMKLNRDSVLKGTTTLEVPASLLRPGANTLTLKRISGTGPLYAVALASAWATGDTVKPAGHLVNVARNFVRHKTEPTLIGTLKITPQPLPSGGSAVAGEQVTAKVTLTVPNDLEYVMVEVPKPAGCEPLNPLSGWDAKIRRVDLNAKSTKSDEEGHAIYREERDDKSVFFLDKLEAGTWEIRFGMRAVTPGDFRALPVQATAMYGPEISANSDAQRVKIHRAEKATGQ